MWYHHTVCPWGTVGQLLELKIHPGRIDLPTFFFFLRTSFLLSAASRHLRCIWLVRMLRPTNPDSSPSGGMFSSFVSYMKLPSKTPFFLANSMGRARGWNPLYFPGKVEKSWQCQQWAKPKLHTWCRHTMCACGMEFRKTLDLMSRLWRKEAKARIIRHISWLHWHVRGLVEIKEWVWECDKQWSHPAHGQDRGDDLQRASTSGPLNPPLGWETNQLD